MRSRRVLSFLSLIENSSSRYVRDLPRPSGGCKDARIGSAASPTKAAAVTTFANLRENRPMAKTPVTRPTKPPRENEATVATAQKAAVASRK